MGGSTIMQQQGQEQGFYGLGPSKEVTSQGIGQTYGSGGLVDQMLSGAGGASFLDQLAGGRAIESMGNIADSMFAGQKGLVGQQQQQGVAEVMRGLGGQFAGMGSGATHSGAFADAASRGVTQAMLAPAMQVEQQRSGMMGSLLQNLLGERSMGSQMAAQAYNPIIAQKALLTQYQPGFGDTFMQNLASGLGQIPGYLAGKGISSMFNPAGGETG